MDFPLSLIDDHSHWAVIAKTVAAVKTDAALGIDATVSATNVTTSILETTNASDFVFLHP